MIFWESYKSHLKVKILYTTHAFEVSQRDKMAHIVTRFAPSPTGYLHIGGLRTALFNYLYARANGGKFLLRIEDTDLARNSTEAAKAIVEAFNWVGLEYDGEVVYQSQRFDTYKQYIKQLLDSKKAYYCYMSKEELEALRAAQEAKKQTPRYDNRYRDFDGTPPAGVAPVVRIKAPLEGEIRFSDGVKGEICIQAKELDDFIIARSDGTPTYNFVVAVDDALMGVTDVIRGDDHLSNTPKQIIVYDALNFTIPRFFHVPMILNPQGRKLSKRDGAMGVMDYYKMGYLPEAILNFLVRLGWSYGDKEIFSLKEMLELFNPNALNSAPSAYNEDKFLWLNAHYIKNTDNAMLEELLSAFNVPKLSPKVREILYPALKDRSRTLVEFAQGFNDVFNAPCEYDEKMRSKLDSTAIMALENLFKDAESDIWESTQNIESYLHHYAAKYELKIGKLMPALRCALLGKSGGIGICEVLATLGKEESCKRIKRLISS